MKIYLETDKNGGVITPYIREVDRLHREQFSSDPALYSKALHAVAKSEPELYASSERILYALRNGHQAILNAAELFAVESYQAEQFRERAMAEVEYFQDIGEFSAAAKTLARQVIAASTGLSVLDLDLLKQCAQYARDKHQDPAAAMPPSLVIMAGLAPEADWTIRGGLPVRGEST